MMSFSTVLLDLDKEQSNCLTKPLGNMKIRNNMYDIALQYKPQVSDRPTKTGRQLQSVAKQFGSIGKTVSAADAD